MVQYGEAANSVDGSVNPIIHGGTASELVKVFILTPADWFTQSLYSRTEEDHRN